MSKVLVIAGTTDAKTVIERLLEKKHDAAVTVTTRLGAGMLDEFKNLDIYQGKLNKEHITELIRTLKPACLIDAANPFSTEITRNAINVCKLEALPYIRYERERVSYEDDPEITIVKNYGEACDVLMNCEGNILLTLGSNKIETFKKIPDYSQRVYLRVLPDWKVLSKCESLGFSPKNMIAIKGPYNEALNIELFKYCQASVLVTKESGNMGGVVDKINAAKKLGIKIILVDRIEACCNNKFSSVEELLKCVDRIDAG
ncbi:precorrin-6A reductase [Acetobacterium malicum]|uniref:Precorrin-6A reductase n=1 Tax=Acetobacterium malicum TaxID=52692 RepID=A0ABR6YWY9_9FIRM|nr:precorrin-6A reductase [Acetobacterium malicum]MBC3899631.1 precorrin-6A reductase [Acetobacterium malicum]